MTVFSQLSAKRELLKTERKQRKDGRVVTNFTNFDSLSRTSTEVRLYIIRAQKLSDFSVSTKSSLRSLWVAYSMVANTTPNTLPTAMATLYQGI